MCSCFCAALSYFPFHLWASPNHCMAPKTTENTQAHNYTVPWPITSQTNKNWREIIKAQMPKTSQATAKLNDFKGRTKKHIPAQIF